MQKPLQFLFCAVVLATAVQVNAQDSDPVTIDVKVVENENNKSRFDVLVEMDIQDGWHAYLRVPGGNPSVVTEIELDLPEGVKTVGDWEKPVGLPDEKDPRAMVLVNRVQFTRVIEATPTSEALDIGVQVNYQVCNKQACLPPDEFTTTVSLPVTYVSKKESDDDAEFTNKHFEAPFRLMVDDDPLNTSANQMYPSPAMFDVDNDGQLELVVGDIFGSINVYENKNDSGGDPVWSPFEPLKSADGEKIKVSNW